MKEIEKTHVFSKKCIDSVEGFYLIDYTTGNLYTQQECEQLVIDKEEEIVSRIVQKPIKIGAYVLKR